MTVHPAPQTPIITQVGDTLFCSSNPYYSFYQWFLNSSIIIGATGTSYVATQSGNYNVEVIDENGCAIAVGINAIIGLNDFKLNLYFNLYPNPVNNSLTISMLQAFHKSDIVIHDMLGRKLFHKTFDSLTESKLILDFHEYPAGTYFLTLTIQGS